MNEQLISNALILTVVTYSFLLFDKLITKALVSDEKN